MVKVVYKYNKKKIINVTITGHALFSNKGYDLVCAGISAIVFGTLNALHQVKETVAIKQEKTANINIKVLKPTIKNQIMLETMYWQLQTIAIQYRKNITIKEIDDKDAL